LTPGRVPDVSVLGHDRLKAGIVHAADSPLLAC
jgi:hypothetical protein